MSQREEALRRTEKEILAEKAATLGRAGARVIGKRERVRSTPDAR